MQYRTGRGLSALVDRSNHKLARKARLEKAVRPCLELMESRRLLSAGDLDPTLDTDGIALAPVSAGNDFGQAIAVQSDGKLVVAGFTFDGFQQNVAVARFNPNGSLDSSFGGDGTVETVFGTPIVANAVAIQNDGKIVVAGTAFGVSGDFAVLRYNSDGTLDGSFGTSGLQTADFSLGEESGAAVAIDASGNIVVAGTRNAGDFAVARFNSSGNLDLGFGSGGKLTTDFSGAADNAFGVVVQADGKIVVGGTSTVNGDQDFALTRYNIDGSVDGTFGVAGATFADFGGNEDIAFALALQADGKIVAAGNSDQFGGGASDFAVARFNTDGSEDVGFGSVTDVAGVLDVATSVAVGGDGKVVAAGYAFDGVTTVFSLTRYNSDGSLDGSFDDGFGATGVVTTQVGDAVHQVAGVAIQSDGKIVVGGAASNGIDFDFAVARYESAGAVVNLPPVAAIGGPYAINEGDALALDASASSDPELGSLTYAWDIDDDGSFDDASGVSPTISWATLQSLLASDDGASNFTINVRVSDGTNNTDASTSVSLGNTAATGTFTGGPAVSLFNPSTVNFSGQYDPSTVDTNAGFTYSYDFNNDGDFADPGDIANSASPSASFTYSTTGTRTVRGRISDKDGGFTDYTANVTVNAPPTASVVPDPINPGTNSALVINGSNNADIIIVLAGANGALQGSFTGTLSIGALAPLAGKPFGRLIIYGNGGNDTIVIGTLNLKTVVFGGNGNDSILTGGGNDILVGGDGNDRLYAGGGNDLVIGGNGGDSLRGDAGNDILIAGTTDFDNDLFALNDVATGVVSPSTSFMNDDAARDTLTGNAGVDRFYANTTDGIILDVITDLSGTETWEDLV